MKVAIIGAGLAGLACAHELERHGVKPVIYEKNSVIGELHPHVTATLEIIHRPIKDAIRYFNKDLYLDIKPLTTVNSLVHHAPRKKTVIHGNFGYFFQRGKESNDVKNQMFSQLKKTKIVFNTLADYKDLTKSFDYVVIATGNSNFAEELGCWQDWVSTYVRGGVVLGDFDPNALLMWIDKDYCKNGYAYLTPFDKDRASLILIATDVTESQIDYFWQQFLYAENLNYKILEEFKLKHKTGYVYPRQLKNIYFAGGALGGIDPFLGFGQLNGITSGVMAGRAIAKGYNYDQLIEHITKANNHLHEFRKAYDRMSNNGYDALVTAIGLPGIKHITYYTPLNIVSLSGPLLKWINRRQEKKKNQK
ncbi:MAG: NAD(P)/FAD-dependent oxidoreductase [Bacillota bacterium]